jgi:Arabinose efflux permease
VSAFGCGDADARLAAADENRVILVNLRTFIGGLRAHPGFPGLLGTTLALGIAHSFVVPYLAIWATEQIGFSSSAFGVFMTVAALCAVVVGTTVARWSDVAVSRRTVLTLGALGGVCGYLGYAFVKEPVVLVGIAMTVIALSTICFPQLFAHVRERFDGLRTGAARGGLLMSIVRVCFSVAWTAGPAVGAVVVQYFGFRGLFISAALLYVIFLFGVRRFVPQTPPKAEPAAKVPVWRVLMRGDILAAFVAFLVVFAAHAINMINLPLMITRELGGSARDLGFVFGVGPVVEIPLMIWFGHLAGRGYQRRLMIVGAAATVLYFALLGFVAHTWQVMLLQMLSGVSFAILTNIAILFFQDLLPGQTGLGTAVFANAGNTGNLAGYLLFGLLIEPFQHRGLYIVCTALGTITLIVISWLRPRAT